MKMFLRGATALALGFAAPVAVHAGTPVLTVTAPGLYDGDGPWVLGWSFDASSSFKVTGLGVWDVGSDGFVAPHQVGLWDAQGTLLASVLVGSADTLIDGFRYASLSPLILGAGRYTVGAAGLGQGDGYVLSSESSTLPGFTYVASNYVQSPDLDYPRDTSGASSGAYFGGNLQVAAVPEPASWAMLIAGFGLTGAAMRRRGIAAAA